MRGFSILALGALSALLVTAALAPLSRVAGCPTQSGMQSAAPHTKPSSFEPHARPPGNAYGMPIGDKILTKRVKKKKPAATRPSTPALA